jgi:acetyl-CoA acyltransferase
MTEAFICDYTRTPIGRFGGALSSMRADDLGAFPLETPMSGNARADRMAVAV